MRIRRYYSSVAEMVQKFKFSKNNPWHEIKINYSFDKRFRWFFTYYHFNESYRRLELNFKLPLEKFMNKDEISFWLTGEPNLIKGMNGIEIHEYTSLLQNQFELWYSKNL